MRKLRPILLRLIVAGVVGAVVTVGVAVGCAMGVPMVRPARPQTDRCLHSETGHEYIVVPQDSAWGTRSVAVLRLQRRGMWVPGGHDARIPPRYPFDLLPHTWQVHTRIVRIAGWPRECVWGAIDRDEVAVMGWASPPKAVHAMFVGRVLDVKDFRGVCGYLPVGPIWSGLAINTLFYGTIAWGLMFLPGTLRRWRRRRGGRCVKCGYDRAGLSGEAACPECGSGARGGGGGVSLQCRGPASGEHSSIAQAGVVGHIRFRMEDRRCLRCGGAMQPGFLRDKQAPIGARVEWVPELAQPSMWEKMTRSGKDRGHPVLTLRCVQCGMLEAVATSQQV